MLQGAITSEQTVISDRHTYGRTVTLLLKRHVLTILLFLSIERLLIEVQFLSKELDARRGQILLVLRYRVSQSICLNSWLHPDCNVL